VYAVALANIQSNRADWVGSTTKSSTYLFSFILASVSLASVGNSSPRNPEARTGSQRVLDATHGDWQNQ